MLEPIRRQQGNAARSSQHTGILLLHESGGGTYTSSGERTATDTTTPTTPLRAASSATTMPLMDLAWNEVVLATPSIADHSSDTATNANRSALSALYYPQLRLRAEHSIAVVPNSGGGGDGVDASTTTLMDTPVILHRAALGTMSFVETLADARHVLERRPLCSSCYIVGQSAIVFRSDNVTQITPVGKAIVQWEAYQQQQDSPKTTPRGKGNRVELKCIVHHKPMELFDLDTKQVVCALCSAITGSPTPRNLMVLSDLISGSNKAVHSTLLQKRNALQRSMGVMLASHQLLMHGAQRRYDAVNMQLQLIQAALDAKRVELLDAARGNCATHAGAISNMILTLEEHVCLVSAAVEHINAGRHQHQSDANDEDVLLGFSPLQLATIAQALQLNTDLDTTPDGTTPREGFATPGLKRSPSTRTNGHLLGSRRQSVDTQPVAAAAQSEQFPQLEELMRSIHAVGGGPSSPTHRTSPMLERPDEVVGRKPTVAKYTSVQSPQGNNQRVASPPRKLSSTTPRKGQRRSSATTPFLEGQSSAVADGSKAHHSPRQPLVASSSSPPKRVPSSRHPPPVAVAEPGLHGTCLFSTDLRELVQSAIAEEFSGTTTAAAARSGGSAGIAAGAKLRTVQWSLRIDDPGDWVGVGVAVGASLDSWQSGQSFDLSHLFFITAHTPRTLVLRISIVGAQCYLGVHDRHGKRLDDARIAHWHHSRPAFPQVSFGGKHGRVSLLNIPTLY